MLRKVSHIFISLLLFIATMGVTISKHYCSGSFVSASVFHEAKSCCGDSDCCHNETEVYQLHEDYSLVSVAEVPQSAEFELLNFAILVYNFSVIETEKNGEFFVADLPPPPKIQTVLSQRQTYLL